MHFKQGEPVVRGSAGVIHWDLSLRFICKEQRDLFVKFLLEQEINYTFDVEVLHGDSATLDVYIVNIEDMSWANNLKVVSKYLEKIDFNSGC